MPELSSDLLLLAFLLVGLVVAATTIVRARRSEEYRVRIAKRKLERKLRRIARDGRRR